MIPISLQPIIISIETANRTKVLLKKRYKLRKWIRGKFGIKLSSVRFLKCWICNYPLCIIDIFSRNERDIFGIKILRRSYNTISSCIVCDTH
jgi:hypothetical protein